MILSVPAVYSYPFAKLLEQPHLVDHSGLYVVKNVLKVQRAPVNCRFYFFSISYTVARHYIDVISAYDGAGVRMLGIFHCEASSKLLGYAFSIFKAQTLKLFSGNSRIKKHEYINVMVAREPCKLTDRADYHCVKARNGLGNGR